MTTVVSSIDPRSAKALEIVATAATWQRGRTKDGRPFYAVPSQSAPNAFHMTDGTACTCRDHVSRAVTCKHIRAVVALEALSAPQVAAAAPAVEQAPSTRVCSLKGCGTRVRPESIYASCEECTYLYGGER